MTCLKHLNIQGQSVLLFRKKSTEYATGFNMDNEYHELVSKTNSLFTIFDNIATIQSLRKKGVFDAI